MSNIIRLSTLQTTFGGSYPISISEYYLNEGLVTDNSMVPERGNKLSLSYFRTPATLQITDIPGSTNVYATRLLNPSYDGPCFKIVRDSDNTAVNVYVTAIGTVEKIITFDDNVTVSGSSVLTSWLEGCTGYVETWYDQVGTSHLTETQGYNQPQYDKTTNAIYINNTESRNIGLSYGKAWEINDATFVINIVPMLYYNFYGESETGDWFFQDPIIGGERPGGVNDFGLVMNGGDNFGFGSGEQDGPPSYIATNGFGNHSVVGMTRTATNGNFALFKDGELIDSGSRQSTGALTGPNPTFVGKSSDGASSTRLNAKMYAIIYYDSCLSSSDVAKVSEVATFS